MLDQSFVRGFEEEIRKIAAGQGEIVIRKHPQEPKSKKAVQKQHPFSSHQQRYMMGRTHVLKP